MRQVLCAALAVLFLVSGCASIRHGLGGRAERKDLCELTVKNETPYTFKFRVGHLWWEEQSGLLQGSAGTMLIEKDEEHVLVRRFFSGGRVREDRYMFYLPTNLDTTNLDTTGSARNDTSRFTITFGGIQCGIVMNHSRSKIRFSSPYGPGKLYELNPGGHEEQVPMMPGAVSIEVEYKVASGVWRSAVVPVHIDEMQGNARIMLNSRVEHVNWTLVITNRMLR